ncbi:hypothetical protein OG21DRAFT_1491123 [Imleria badia]|nr:hypothetical protein OG21DRAFT_1491123 [Imleria badia]
MFTPRSPLIEMIEGAGQWGQDIGTNLEHSSIIRPLFDAIELGSYAQESQKDDVQPLRKGDLRYLDVHPRPQYH